jgi:hypothetical protein
MDKQKPLKKMRPYTAKWERMADAEARMYAPTINPCKDCGRPVVYGFCCRHCGSTSP